MRSAPAFPCNDAGSRVITQFSDLSGYSPHLWSVQTQYEMEPGHCGSMRLRKLSSVVCNIGMTT